MYTFLKSSHQAGSNHMKKPYCVFLPLIPGFAPEWLSYRPFIGQCSCTRTDRATSLQWSNRFRLRRSDKVRDALVDFLAASQALLAFTAPAGAHDGTCRSAASSALLLMHGTRGAVMLTTQTCHLQSQGARCVLLPPRGSLRRTEARGLQCPPAHARHPRCRHADDPDMPSAVARRSLCFAASAGLFAAH